MSCGADMTNQDRDADRLALADRIRAHIGTIAPKCSLPVGEWNDIAEDFYEAADQLFAHPAEPQGAREERTGRHVLNTAKSLGWPDDGEGALEFMLRRAREVAFEDCGKSTSPSPVQADALPMRAFGLKIVAVLEQAQDCIRGETPEDMTDEQAREDTISKLRELMFDPRLPDLIGPASANEVKP